LATVGLWLEQRPVAPPRLVLPEAPFTPRGRGFGVRAPAFWVKANLHSHALKGKCGIGDDGRSPPRVMHEVYERLGYDFSAHTPHSNRNTSRSSAEVFIALKEYEEGELDQQLSISRTLGIELSVAHGPNLRWFKVRRYGRGVGRTINHALILATDEYVPHLSQLKSGAEMAHVFNGLFWPTHPVMWEDDYWDRPEHVDKLDAMEVYNGIVLVKTGETEENNFRRSVAYSGLGARLAAVTGTDAHGLAWAKEVVTWVHTTANDLEGIVEGIRQRKTFATRGLFDLDLEFPQLGRVIRSAEVALDLSLNRPLERVELWREQELVQTWSRVDEVRWREQIDRNVAYTFKLVEGEEFGYTSPVWYEPEPQRLPDLVIPKDRLELRGQIARIPVRNVGESTVATAVVAVHGQLPYRGAKPIAELATGPLPPGEEVWVEARFPEPPALVYAKVDPESYTRGDDDAVHESDERNNAAVLVLSGPLRGRLDRAEALRQRRVARRTARGMISRTAGRARPAVESLLPEHEPGATPELEEHTE